MDILKKIENRLRYTKSQKKYLNKLKPYSGGEWDISTARMKQIKSSINAQLNMFQAGHCAYCGLDYTVISGAEIEHIAPKGGKARPHHTKFTFTPYNLVLSCHYCNAPGRKGVKETINGLAQNYHQCQFNIVHPYFDSPKDHYQWIVDGSKILISYKSLKGKNSIEMFKLDSTAHSEARARMVYYEYIKSRQGIEYLEREIKAALEYRPA